jgi:hypothetical protein
MRKESFTYHANGRLSDVKGESLIPLNKMGVRIAGSPGLIVGSRSSEEGLGIVFEKRQTGDA